MKLNFPRSGQCLVGLLLFSLTSCHSHFKGSAGHGSKMKEELSIVKIDRPVFFTEDVEYKEEVAIWPGARISTAPDVLVTFLSKVDIIGETQVFDLDANLRFESGTISKLNPLWFGAKGYDTGDDTKAFQKVLHLSKDYHGSITIHIPVGRYFISETLEVECNPEHNKSINLMGESMSNNSVQGSSLSWTGAAGGTLIRFKHVNQFFLENLDFTAEPRSRVKHNIELEPLIHQMTIRHCSFTGAGGDGSSNIDLNEGNGDQVSEIHFDNCAFNGLAPGTGPLTESAIRGGLANTKNFYVLHSAFSGYALSAIDIEISDVLRVEGCTFANNEIDIACGLCGTYAISNYSEHSKAFFNGGVSSNVARTTLVNNMFVGKPKEGYVVRDGAGSLVLINNDFGGGDQADEENRIRWDNSEFSPVYSVGNFFKNASKDNFPFYNRSGQRVSGNIVTIGDIGGKSGTSKVTISE